MVTRLRGVLLALPAVLAASAASAQANPVKFLDYPVRWTPGIAETRAPRAALIVCADDYAKRGNWYLSSAKESAEKVRRCLTRYAGMPEHAVEVVRGKDAHKDGIRAALQKVAGYIGPRADGALADGLLIVYWIGHGTTLKRELHLLTHYSDSADAGYAPTVSQSEIEQWMQDAQDQVGKRHGSKPQTVAFFDCCREASMSTLEDYVVGGAARDWQVYSTAKGQLASEKTVYGATAFSHSFAKAMEKLAEGQGTASLLVVYNELKHELHRITISQAGKSQVPEIVAPGTGVQVPTLVQETRIHFEIRLIDAIEGLLVTGRDVSIDGRQTVAQADGRLATCALGSRRVKVVADGYLERSESVEVEGKHSGGVLEIPVLRARTLVFGTLSPPRAGVVVRALSRASTKYLDADYYEVEATADDGRFELRVPREATTLQVLAGGEVVQDVPLAADTADTAVADAKMRHIGTRAMTLTVSLSADALAAIDARLGTRASVTEAETVPKANAKVEGSPPAAKDATQPVAESTGKAVPEPPAAAPAPLPHEILARAREARASGSRGDYIKCARELQKADAKDPVAYLMLGEVQGSASNDAPQNKSAAIANLKKFRDLTRDLEGSAADRVRECLAAVLPGESAIEHVRGLAEQWIKQLEKDDWLMRVPDEAFLATARRKAQELVEKSQEVLQAKKADLSAQQSRLQRAQATLDSAQRRRQPGWDTRPEVVEASRIKNSATQAIQRLEREIKQYEKDLANARARVKKYGGN